MKVIIRALRTLGLKLLVLPLFIGISNSLMPMQESVALKAIEQGRKSHDVPLAQPVAAADSSHAILQNTATNPFHVQVRIDTVQPNFVSNKITGYANQALQRDGIGHSPIRTEIKSNPIALHPNAAYDPASKISEKTLQRYEFIKKHIFEPLLAYKDFSALMARQLLMEYKKLAENEPNNSPENNRLYKAYDDITKIICHPNGVFKEIGSLSKKELDAIAHIYLQFLNGDRQELLDLVDQNKISADTAKGFDITSKSELDMAISNIKSALNGGIQRAYNAFNKTPMNAWFHSGNRTANAIIAYIKQGHYKIALEQGDKTGYFKARPLEAALIRQECERLLKEQHLSLSDAEKRVIIDYIMSHQEALLKDFCDGYSSPKLAAGNGNYLNIVTRRAQVLKDILAGKIQYHHKTYSLPLDVKDTIHSFGMNSDTEHLYGNELQHVLYNEVHTLLTYAATVNADNPLKAENIIICALSAQESAQLGDIKTALYFADKAWKYAHPDIRHQFPRVPTKDRIVFTPELLKQAYEQSLKQEPFDLTSLKQEQSLFPEAEKFLTAHEIKPEEFSKSIDDKLNPEIIKTAIEKVLQENKKLEKDSTETPEQIVLRFYGLIGKKIIDNLTHPHTFIKRSFIDPIVSAGTSLGNFLDKHGKTIVQGAILSADTEDGIYNPELRQQFTKGVDALSEDINQSINNVSELIKALPNLPAEQSEELVATLFSDLITADIFGTAFSSIFKELDKVKTSEKIAQIVSDMNESRIIEAIRDKAIRTFENIEKIAHETVVMQEEGVVSQMASTSQKGEQFAQETSTVTKTANTIQKGEQVAQETSAASQTTKIGETVGKTGTIVEGQFKPLGRGSTGRSVPKDLHEQVALREIMSDPSKGTPLDINKGKGMSDPRWHKNDGWEKRAWYSEELKKDIHYVIQKIDGVITAVDDFKFIDK